MMVFRPSAYSLSRNPSSFSRQYSTPAVSGVISSNIFRYFSTDSFAKPASSSSLAKPSSSSSFATPSRPILSILSRMINTVSKLSFGNPLYSAIAFRIRRSLIRIVKFLKSSFPSSVVVARISSISARLVGSPRISISHCMNWRYLPLCGRSARHTFPI